MTTTIAIEKPAYRVPLMEEINATLWNGFNVASLFSGCGGSSLGYKMAGFKVLYANEFIPTAQDTYRANHKDTFLDTRDIRVVKSKEILEAIKLKPGELDLLDGSPPCASFSTAGKREADWGKVKQYSDTKQRTDDLFFEYARILKGLKPKVFVAENVSGLVKGTAKGYFLEILKELKNCDYNVKVKLLDAQWLGVPQMRQRTIFVGVRNDLEGLEPRFPEPLNYRYSVREAIPWIVAQGDNGEFGLGSMRISNSPSPTIGTGTQAGNVRFPPSLVEAETDISRYAIGKLWDEIKPGENHYKRYNLAKPGLDSPSPTLTCPSNGQFSPTAPFSSASLVHPTEKRKFSIAELKRICAFPDDFILTGSYAQQWERLGRAVPPVMMFHIAKTIRDEILCKIYPK